MRSAPRRDAPSLWASVARIAATFCIFAFHFLHLEGLPQHRLDFGALLTFSFLSGYFADARRGSRRVWFAKRYFSVMIPHWLVIVPVLIANAVEQYKPVTPTTAVITVLGGNMFLVNPVYVITWYVTFVLLLYTYALADSFLHGSARWLLAAAGLLLFGVELGRYHYFIAFLLGLLMQSLPARRATGPAEPSPASLRLFAWQRFCYPFFLTHGAVLLAFVQKTDLHGVRLFTISLAISAVTAIAVERVASPLIRMAVTAAGGRTRTAPVLA
jgi:hypothetical protein